ncbi:MAG: hypothetical protein A2W93_01430 [Bacteroidetes bacterium GWF2_43_63]|nr:MAG: hypothetical protein A2W94_10640 [Bacteroidetes bacterium GWE2_42_42]OFY55736.1 MAG: hypothetical protein A2W93_01430 [Bacteroidetes bacterium GWF2_43_63]HBG69453.1 heptosyltransferase [Bacteroidales bacterium]HCB61381.1 heptosyltransferase [Bacteroidales bacterium]HCY24255.1 heptosyltransferase [Bacteroidales bacterium]
MKKVLFIQTASLGDVILATATAHSVRALFPDALIFFLVKESCADVLNNCPVIDQVLVWNKKDHKYRNLLSILKEIRREKFDAVINFQRFFSSGFITAFSGGKIKAGFTSNPLSLFFNRKARHEQNGTHEIVRNLTLGRQCFPGLQKANPVIAVEKPADQALLAIAQSKYITIFPGSLWATKQYPVKQWIDFVSEIPSELKVIIAGSNADVKMANDLSAARPMNTWNLCGKLSILESAWIMKYAAMNFTNDSAPTHLASAVNASVATIFCSTIPAFGFTPLSDNSKIIEYLAPLKCRPCGIHGHKSCPQKHFDCGNKIETKQLTELL